MSAPVLVIAVGNPYRRDDGVGLAVLEHLSQEDLPGVTLVEESGESAALISRWQGAPFVVLVDAVSSGATAGTVHRLERGDGQWSVGARSAQASTHSLGVGSAIELGRVLDCLPDRLVLFGVETADVGNGEGLTSPVAAAVPAVAKRIAAEVAAVQTGVA